MSCENCTPKPPQCKHCDRELLRQADFCGTPCRKRAWRRRRAGLPENAYPGEKGARRGRVPLGEATMIERLTETLREIPVTYVVRGSR